MAQRAFDLGAEIRCSASQVAYFVGHNGETGPASPARAASIAALSASRSVWAVIVSTSLSSFSAAPTSSRIRSKGRRFDRQTG